MMKSPWTQIDSAFDAMFSEAAEFVTTSDKRATVACCIFPIEDVDPFADTDVTSDVKRINIVIRQKEWMSFKERPTVGNLVITPDGSKWKIETSDMEQDWWSLKARSI